MARSSLQNCKIVQQHNKTTSPNRFSLLFQQYISDTTGYVINLTQFKNEKYVKTDMKEICQVSVAHQRPSLHVCHIAEYVNGALGLGRLLGSGARARGRALDQLGAFALGERSGRATCIMHTYQVAYT
jgi:hypothetical protein